MTSQGANVGTINIGTEARPPFVRLPDATRVFQRRADRLQALSGGNPLGDYLAFIARLVRAQAKAMQALPNGRLPGAERIAHCHEYKLALLDHLTWPRDSSWQAALDVICAELRDQEMPAAAGAALEGLARMDAARREELADRALESDQAAADPAFACFVNAALQVYWTRMAAMLEPGDVRALEPLNDCPVCGSAPIASVVHAEGSLQGVRFLCCALCNSEWHSVRIKCANCQSTRGIAYQHIVEQDDGIKAETCDECWTYTKIVYKDKITDAEPFADDLATVALDILVGEAGWARATPNPFLVPAMRSN